MDEAAKRKRLSDNGEQVGQPAAKRTAATQPSSQDCRAAIARVYAAYDALHRMKDTSVDGQYHFAVLLNAARGMFCSRVKKIIFLQIFKLIICFHFPYRHPCCATSCCSTTP